MAALWCEVLTFEGAMAPGRKGYMYDGIHIMFLIKRLEDILRLD